MRRWVVVSLIILASLVPLLAGLFERSADSSTAVTWNGFTLPLKSGEGLVFACCDPTECIAKGDCCDCPTTTTTDNEDDCNWYCNDCGCQLCSPPQCDEEEEDPCKDVECGCGNKKCPKGKICENQKCRLPRIGESCDSNVGCAEGQCYEGCSGDWICCKKGKGAYCDDPPGGGGRGSYCGNQSDLDPNPKKDSCYGCLDSYGDCYPVGSCVTSTACSSGWAKCHLENNNYVWACAAEAECGGSGGGGGGTGDVNEPTFDLLEVRVDILHDGINPEEPILKVECDSERVVEGLEVVLEILEANQAGTGSSSPITGRAISGPITIPGEPGDSTTSPSPPGIPIPNESGIPVGVRVGDGSGGGTSSSDSIPYGTCRFDKWEGFTAVFYCNYGEKGESRATCRFTGDQNLCDTCEVSKTFTIPEPILSVSVDKQAAKIGESILVNMTGRSWIYVDRVDLLVDGQVARTFDHAGQKLLNIRDSTSIQLPKGRHEIAFRATDFVGDSFESNTVNVLVGSNAYYCQISPVILQSEDCGAGCSLQVSCFAKNGTPEMCPAMEWEATAGRIEGIGEEATYYSTNESAVITATGTLMECSALVVGSLEQPSLVNGVDLVLLSSSPLVPRPDRTIYGLQR